MGLSYKQEIALTR